MSNFNVFRDKLVENYNKNVVNDMQFISRRGSREEKIDYIYRQIKPDVNVDVNINTNDVSVVYEDKENCDIYRRDFNRSSMCDAGADSEINSCIRSIATQIYIRRGSNGYWKRRAKKNKEEETMKKIGNHCSLISELAKATDAEYSIDCSYGVKSEIRLTIEDNPMNLTRNLDAFVREFSTTIDKNDIVDVKTYADRVVVVKFADGTYTKCEVQGEDQFNEDVGIAYCLFKKALGEKGHDKFNDLLRHAHKVKAKNEKLAKDKEQKKLERELKKAEMKEKAEAVNKKAREETVDILKEAIVAALDEHGKGCMLQGEEIADEE